MNTGILDKLYFPHPPIELQNRFASIVQKVEFLRILHVQSLEKLENLYGALSQKAFKGKLDLSRIPLAKIPEKPISDTTTQPADQFTDSGRYAQIGNR